MSRHSDGWIWDSNRKRDVYPVARSEVGECLPLERAHPNSIAYWLIASGNRDRIQHHLTRYFTKYNGRHFEWLINQTSSPRLTPWDILAIESLSIRPTPDTTRWLLEPDSRRDSALDLLEPVAKEQTTLWECNLSLLRPGGVLSDLYEYLRSKDFLSPVVVSKLMATKFPHLVPIRDSKVERLLDMRGRRQWWEPIRELLTDDQGRLIDYLWSFRIPQEMGSVSLLRRLDVVLWMEAKAREET